MDEQMRLFESEIQQQNNFHPRGGHQQPFRPPAFMPSSVRVHHGGGGFRGGGRGMHHGGGGPPQNNYGGDVPPPPSYPRPQYIHNPNPHENMNQFARQSLTPLPRPPNLVKKEFTALPQISKPSDTADDDDDIMATLMKYEQEAKEEKGDKKKRKSDEQGDATNKFPRTTTSSAPVQKSGTEFTPEEIKKKAKQMVEAVKASQVVEVTKKAIPPTNTKGGKKNKKMIRMAGGQMWEDSSLLGWDSNDYRLFCGDLGNDVTDEVLNRTFGKYATFIQARVIRDKRTNKTKGYGFVSFKDPADFTKAIKEIDGKYVGSRPIKLRRSCWKDRNMDQVKKKEKSKQKEGYKGSGMNHLA